MNRLIVFTDLDGTLLNHDDYGYNDALPAIRRLRSMSVPIIFTSSKTLDELQQQDFVSAVSHEAKTPLTSIRMYGEVLQENWASEEKKKNYYDMIVGESQRLTRLINNVLQLARFSRNAIQISIRDHGPGIPKDQMKKCLSFSIGPRMRLHGKPSVPVFGLALVSQLMPEMLGAIDVQNANPGARFILSFRSTD